MRGGCLFFQPIASIKLPIDWNIGRVLICSSRAITLLVLDLSFFTNITLRLHHHLTSKR